MKRITVTLPDELAAWVDRERRRRDVSAATVIRDAIGEQLGLQTVPLSRTGRFSFIGIGSSDGKESLGENAEEILAREWADRITEDSGLSREQHNVHDLIEKSDPSEMPEAQSA